MNESIRNLATRRAIAVVATVSALTLVCTTTEQRAPNDSRTGPQAVELAAAIVESPATLGIADSDVIRTGSVEEVNRHLDLLQSLGVQNVRVSISWYAIQPSENGSFDWGTTDYMIEEANRRGMGVLGVLHETPVWAGNPPLSGMPNPDAYGSFAGAVAERYAGKVSALEVWNEPNGKLFLNPVDPAGYTALLRAAYTAIKQYDDPDDPEDDITVIAGVLGSGRTVGDISLNPVTFLRDMYSAGAHGYFDAFSFHPYQRQIRFSRGEALPDSPILQLRAIRELMQANGDGALKVWATEYGLSTAPFNPLLPLQYNSLSKQAQFIADFLASWPEQEGTGPMFIYSAIDLNSGSFLSENNYGVFFSNGRPKPAAQIIVDYLNGSNPDVPGAGVLDGIRAVLAGTVRLVGTVINGAVNVATGVALGIVGAVASVASWVLGDSWLVSAPRDLVTGVVRLVAGAITGTADTIVGVVDRVLGIDRSVPAVTRMAPATTDAATDDSPTVADDLSSPGELAGAETTGQDATQTTGTETTGTETTGLGTTGSGTTGTETTGLETTGLEPTGTETTGLETTGTKITAPEGRDPEILEPELTEVKSGGQPGAPEAPTGIGSGETARKNQTEAHTEAHTGAETETDGSVATTGSATPSTAGAQGSEKEPASVGAE